MNARSATVRRRAFTYTIVAAVICAASYLIGVVSPVGQRVEKVVLDAAQLSTDPLPPLAWVTPATLGFAVLVISLAAWITYGPLTSIVLVFTIGVTLLASQLLKVGLDRPDHAIDALVNSFPSGHMTIFVSLLFAALLTAVPKARLALMVLGALVLCVVSWQLLAYGWHRPSDIVGALTLTITTFSCAVLLFPSLVTAQPRWRATLHTRSSGTLRALSILSAVVLVFSLGLFALGLMTSSVDVATIAAQTSQGAASVLALVVFMQLIHLGERSSRSDAS